jgi:putative tryptophan/tyrosine transport system substrate-binding protein
MQRREFITILGGAAIWPLTARAQQQMPRVGVLSNLAEHDPAGQSRNAVFLERMQQLGWSDGRNLRIDYRFALGEAGLTRKYAGELVALAPEVILATGTEVTAALQQSGGNAPIVFVLVPDPVGAGFVRSLAHPGGNITGFTPFEYGIAAKWLELLKGIDPRIEKVAVLRDASTPEAGQFATIQAAAPSLGIEASHIEARDAGEIEQVITAFARVPNAGLVVPGLRWQQCIASRSSR